MATDEQIKELRDFIAGRKTAYRAVFTTPEGRRVLDDLRVFCRADITQSTFHSDPRGQAAYEGRREVFNRILQHMELALDPLVELYSGVNAYGDQTNG